MQSDTKTTQDLSVHIIGKEEAVKRYLHGINSTHWASLVIGAALGFGTFQVATLTAQQEAKSRAVSPTGPAIAPPPNGSPSPPPPPAPARKT